MPSTAYLGLLLTTLLFAAHSGVEGAPCHKRSLQQGGSWGNRPQRGSSRTQEVVPTSTPPAAGTAGVPASGQVTNPAVPAASVEATSAAAAGGSAAAGGATQSSTGAGTGSSSSGSSDSGDTSSSGSGSGSGSSGSSGTSDSAGDGTDSGSSESTSASSDSGSTSSSGSSSGGSGGGGLGLAINDADVSGTAAQLNQFGASWYYNWALTPTGNAPDGEFVPMLWGPGSKDGLEAAKASWNGVKTILAFNEPDGDPGTGGSTMGAQEAAQQHVELLNDLPYKIGAPAVRDSDQTWFKDWEAACESLGGCRWEILPLHWYGDKFEDFKTFLDTTIDERGQGKEVWLIEVGQDSWVTGDVTNGLDRLQYGCVIDWVNDKPVPCAAADIKTFMKESLAYIKQKGITRYSYFGAFLPSANKAFGNEMMDNSGQMNELGKIYTS